MNKKPDYLAAIYRAQEKLRKTKLSKRTSTYREGSIRQSQGTYAEVEAQRWLQEELVCAGSDWTVVMWQEAKRELFGLGPFDTGGHWEPIRNSQNGDLYVYGPGSGPTTLWTRPDPELLFSIEVKSSRDWPSASINYSELFNSSAKYLLAITTAGTWICTMDDARKQARAIETYKTTFYTVDPAAVKNLTIKEIIDAEEEPRGEAQVHHPIGRDDIPF